MEKELQTFFGRPASPNLIISKNSYRKFMTSDHETLTRIWLGNETEKFGTKWVWRLQALAGLALSPTCPCSCHREGNRGEVPKWKGRKVLPGFTKWERPAPAREAQSLFSQLGKRPVSAAPGSQQNQQQSSPHFKGSWIRPMSRAFQRLILKSFVLITLPEGKQRSGLCIHTGTRAHS